MEQKQSFMNFFNLLSISLQKFVLKLAMLSVKLNNCFHNFCLLFCWYYTWYQKPSKWPPMVPAVSVILSLWWCLCFSRSTHTQLQYGDSSVWWNRNGVDNIASATFILNSSPPRQNGRHFTDDILRCIFMNEKILILIKISLKFLCNGPIDNSPALV